MQSRRTIINALVSTLQFLVNSLSLFILYRFLIRELGSDKLGLWSLMTAITSTTAVANLGLGGVLVKFIAESISKKEEKEAAHLIETAFLSTFFILGLILLLVYPFIEIILNSLIPTSQIPIAKEILPWILFAFWMSSIGQIFQSGIDGLQRLDLRTTLQIFNEIGFLLLSLFLIPRFGFKGLAYSFCGRSFILLFANQILLKKLLPPLPIILCRWRGPLFKKMIGYGLNFQVITIVQMIFDPMTKALLSRFGGLEITGLYEMAYRMLTQLRGMLVSANQALIPLIAHLKSKSEFEVHKVYIQSFRLMLFIMIPFYGLTLALIPLISEIWLGQTNLYFMTFCLIILIAYFFNNLCIPAYFTNLGTGELRSNVIAHTLMGGINLGFGLILGKLIGPYGAVIAWGIANSVGGLYIFLHYSSSQRISSIALVKREDFILALECGLFLLGPLLVYYFFPFLNPFFKGGLVLIAYGVPLLIIIWPHSMRFKIQGLFHQLIKKTL